MKLKELIKIVQETFHESLGSLVTGSQASRLVFVDDSDIDIVVFNLSCSFVTNHLILIGEYKIDCTIVPLHDIHNVIANELNDSRGVLITMIDNGSIIYDTNSVILNIKRSLSTLLLTIKSKGYLQHNLRLLGDLSRINKYLKRNLTEKELFCIMCDFVNIITSIKALQIELWDSHSFRKTKILEAKENSFLQEVQDIFYSVVLNNDKSNVVEYIEKVIIENRVESLPLTNLEVDISISGYSFREFCNLLMSLIKSNTILSSNFCYFFKPEIKYHRIYQNNICIHFNLPTNTSVMELIGALIGGLNSVGVKKTQLRVVKPPPLIENINNLSQLTKLRASLCCYYTQFSSDNKEKIKILALAISLCIDLKKTLDLSSQDGYQICDILLNRWLVSWQREDKIEAVKKFQKLAAEKMILAENDFIKFKTDLYSTILKISEENIYQELVFNCNNFYKACTLKDLLNFFPNSFFEVLLIENVTSARGFLLFSSEIFNMMNLSDGDRVFCLFAIKDLFME